MTHAANVISGYALTAAAVMAYAVWVVCRGRSLGRSLGIGSDGAGDSAEHSRSDGTGDPAAGSAPRDLAGSVASASSPGDKDSRDAAAAAP